MIVVVLLVLVAVVVQAAETLSSSPMIVVLVVVIVIAGAHSSSVGVDWLEEEITQVIPRNKSWVVSKDGDCLMLISIVQCPIIITDNYQPEKLPPQ